ncbi:MAG: glycosyl hydrolase family 57, partial [Crinalium sp.]
AVTNAINELKQTNHNFHMDGASWTNHISWVQGYENVLTPLNQLSALFHEKIDPLVKSNSETLTQQAEYRQALMHNLLLQTSCFRYWGQGAWTDYAREIYKRGEEVIQHQF